MYHHSDICENMESNPKNPPMYICDCPVRIDPSLVFRTGTHQGRDCAETSMLTRADVAQHRAEQHDCWVVIWRKCPSQKALCSRTEKQCDENSYVIADLSRDVFKHPGPRNAIKRSCGKEIFNWYYVPGSGHPSVSHEPEKNLAVRCTKLADIYEKCEKN